MTIVEMLIAASIVAAVWGGMLTLVVEVAREQRAGLAGSTMEQKADNLQDRLMSALRKMSAGESVVFANPIDDGDGFCRIIVAQGKAPEYPREEILFNPTSHSVTHNQDLSHTGHELSLFNPSSDITLRKVFFYPSLKPGGLLDGSSLNVWIEADDNGLSGQRNFGGLIKTNTVVRSFSVQMRNP
jgi:hypothetical protein